MTHGIDGYRVARGNFRDFDGKSLRFATPESFRGCASFTVAFAYAFDDFKNGSLCWMTSWGIDSPELEEMGTFFWKALRPGTHGELLNDYPGHLCGANESLSVRSLLILAMSNVWDCVWIEATGEAILFISHDGYVEFRHRGKNAEQMIAQIAEWVTPNTGTTTCTS